MPGLEDLALLEDAVRAGGDIARKFYGGDYKAALAEFTKGNQNDPFVLSLIAQSHEKLGDQAAAMDHYKKVMTFTTHNPNNAFARPLARKKLGL